MSYQISPMNMMKMNPFGNLSNEMLHMKMMNQMVPMNMMNQMDPKLKEAACSGDVDFLKQEVASSKSKPPNYFLSQFMPSNPAQNNNNNDVISGNILHLAAGNGNVAFFEESLASLPKVTIQMLLSQKNKMGLNPLHVAANLKSQSFEIVKLILDFYKGQSHIGIKPWLALARKNETPLHMAIKSGNEESAMKIMSMDMKLLCQKIDMEGNSPLFLAVKSGFNRVAEKILESSDSYSLNGECGSTPLHFAPSSSENVLRLLLEKHPELIDKVDNNDEGFNIIHQWAKIGEVWPLNWLLKQEIPEVKTKVFKNLIMMKSDFDDNPLHIATSTKKENLEFVKVLIHGYQQEMAGEMPESLDCSPWKEKNGDGDTPLHVALQSKQEQVALHLLSLDSTSCEMENDNCESLLFLAVKNGMNQVAEKILNSSYFYSVSGEWGYTPLHFAPHASEKILRLLLEKHRELIDAVDVDGFNVIHEWAKRGKDWPLNWLLLQPDFPEVRTKVFKDLIMMKSNDFRGDNPVHIAAASTKENTDFLKVLICGYQQEMAGEVPDHSLLDCPPWKAKNNDGNTPLHVALKSKQEQAALYLLSLDPTTSQIDNLSNESSLFLAVKNGMNQIAEKILTESCPYSLSCPLGYTPFHYAPCSSENVLRLLMEKHSDCIEVCGEINGFTVLHQWANIGEVWPLKWLKENFTRVRINLLKNFIMKPDKVMGDTPLHVAARCGSATMTMPPFDITAKKSVNPPFNIAAFIDFVQELISGFEETREGEMVESLLKVTNKNGDTPLHVALSFPKGEELALHLLSLDLTLCEIDNIRKESPLFLAVKNKMTRVAEKILESDSFSVSGSNGFTPLHYAPHCSEKVFKKLLHKDPKLVLIRNTEDDYNALHQWAEMTNVWPLKLLLEEDCLKIRTTDFWKSIMKPVKETKDNLLHILVKGIQPPYDINAMAMGVPPSANLKGWPLSSTPSPSMVVPPLGPCNPVTLNGEIVEIMKRFISSYQQECISTGENPAGYCPPWKVKNMDGDTVVHMLLSSRCEELALYILLLDETICEIANDKKESLLFLAVKNGMNEVVKKILSVESCTYSASAPEGYNPLHYVQNCSDQTILKLLLDKHPHFIDNVNDEGLNVLHQWVANGTVWHINRLIQQSLSTKVFMDLIYKRDEVDGNTPLHIAAKVAMTSNQLFPASRNVHGFKTGPDWTGTGFKTNTSSYPANSLMAARGGSPPNPSFPATGPLSNPLFPARGPPSNPLFPALSKNNVTIMQQLLNAYRQLQTRRKKALMSNLPWQVQNKNGNTPLHEALSFKNEEDALFILSLDLTSCQILNNDGESPLFLAVRNGCSKVVEKILSSEDPRFSTLRCNDGQTVLHCLRFCPENTCRRLLEKCWWIINLRDDKGRTAFDVAKEENVKWLVDMLSDLSAMKKEPFNCITACDKDEMAYVIAFIDNDVLHHIKLQTYQDYLNLLKNPTISELKNYITESDGATPLHRAILRKEMHLAKVLLKDNEVERNIKDRSGKTAMDLLAELCENDKKWQELCEHIKLNPRLKTTYIQPGTNLDQMRNTLSVVAALLATITFAAGFTLPGGLKSETGNAMLAKKASFVVFLLADAFAMCTSMLVLCCLIWSMVSKRDMSYLLVDRSVLILLQSLYATMVAFMTGIYTVIEHSILWVAIIIFVMCSFIGISANRTVLHYVIANLIPAANPDRRIEGEKSTDASNDSMRIEGRVKNLLKHFISIPFSGVKKLLPIRNQGRKAQDHIVKENSCSEEASDQSGKGTSTTILHQNTNSSMRQRKSNPTENQNQKASIQLVEQEQHSTSRNNVSKKASGHITIDI